MNVTKTDLFKGCLLASIAHAIMTNVYPEFSYEQSWDGSNYSINDSSGTRGTITFESDYCVGAVRNESAASFITGEHIRENMKNFPSYVVDKAYEETLQYLLLENNGTVESCVTSVFWADKTSIHFEETCIDTINRDFALFENILLPKETAIEKWKEYYDMDQNAVELTNVLYQLKERSFFSIIELDEDQKHLIPGVGINDECAESLKELNII